MAPEAMSQAGIIGAPAELPQWGRILRWNWNSAQRPQFEGELPACRFIAKTGGPQDQNPIGVPSRAARESLVDKRARQ